MSKVFSGMGLCSSEAQWPNAIKTRSVISSIIAGSAASSASVMAARTRSGSISVLAAKRLRAASRSLVEAAAERQRMLGEQAARQSASLISGLIVSHHLGRFERLLEDRVAAGPAGLVFVERLQQIRRSGPRARGGDRDRFLRGGKSRSRTCAGRNTSARIRSGSTSREPQQGASPSVTLTTSKPSSRRMRSPMRCACGLSSASRMRLIKLAGAATNEVCLASFLFLLLLALLPLMRLRSRVAIHRWRLAAIHRPAWHRRPVADWPRASGLVSSADGPVTVRRRHVAAEARSCRAPGCGTLRRNRRSQRRHGRLARPGGIAHVRIRVARLPWLRDTTCPASGDSPAPTSSGSAPRGRPRESGISISFSFFLAALSISRSTDNRGRCARRLRLPVGGSADPSFV